MRLVLSCILLVLYSLSTPAQNLVPNGDFENYNVCPLSLGRVTECTGWRQYHLGTPDYFHSCCAITPGVGIPTNIFGSQPAKGNGYMGIFLWHDVSLDTASNYKEYFARTITPMIAGAVYEVSMSVSMADVCDYASSDIGVFFYDKGPANQLPAGLSALKVTPQVHYGSMGPFTDKTNWKRLVAYYTADSAYDNIVIGGFTPYTSMPLVNVGGGTGWYAKSSYYYIDSVVVKIASSIINLFADTIMCARDTFQVSYMVTNNQAFNPNNIFTVQLSDASGSFASGVTVLGNKMSNTSGSISCVIPPSVVSGTNYRIRITATNAPDTSGASPYPIHIFTNIPKPIAGSNAPICIGQVLRLYANGINNDAVTYAWTGPGAYTNTDQHPIRQPAVPGMSGNYIVTATLGTNCIQKDTIGIMVQPPPAKPVLTSNSPVCEGEALNIAVASASPGVTYTWAGPNSFSSQQKTVTIAPATRADTGMYILICGLNGCIAADSIHIVIKESPPPVTASANTPLCEPETLHLGSTNSTAGATYVWKGPGGYAINTQNADRPNSNQLMSGRYLITVTLNGCSVTDTVTAIVNPSPADVSIISNSPVCLHDSLTLHAYNDSANVTYTWSGPDSFFTTGASVVIPAFTKYKAGDYTVTAALGDCKKTTTTNITLLDANFELGNDELFCNGETKLLKLSVPTAAYLWQDGSTSGEYMVTQAGRYWVQATTKCGTKGDTLDVAYEQCDCSPFVPNAFTPNNDGLNDNIAPILNCEVSKYDFMIVNRFGQPVFRSDDPMQKWDGSYKGEPADLATYCYLLQLTGPRNKQFFFKGDIVLIR